MSSEYQEQYISSNNYTSLLQYVLWFLTFIFFAFSSLSLSLIFYLSAVNEWDIAKHYSTSNLDFALHTFPFPLLLIFIPSLLFVISSFKFSSFGKRLSLYLVFIIISFLVVCSSLLLFYAGTSKSINNALSKQNFYQVVSENRNELWQNPNFGLLSGEIAAISDIDNFLLIDFDNKTWKIQSHDPKVINKIILSTGEKIKILGRKNDESSFEAKEIRAY